MLQDVAKRPRDGGCSTDHSRHRRDGGGRGTGRTAEQPRLGAPQLAHQRRRALDLAGRVQLDRVGIEQLDAVQIDHAGAHRRRLQLGAHDAVARLRLHLRQPALQLRRARREILGARLFLAHARSLAMRASSALTSSMS
jgi:hypothetical protein